jgi:hypothetical protein
MAAQDDASPHELLHHIESWSDDPRRAFAAIGALRAWLDETEKGLKTHAKE